MFKQNILKQTSTFLKTQKKFVNTNRHHTRFDIYLDWYSNFVFSKHLSLSRIFAAVNLGLFLYANFRYRDYNRFQALAGVSYSLNDFKRKEYTPLFGSLLGARRIDDLLLETGILATLGHSLEKLYGKPFFIKMFVFSYYIGILSSLYWVNSNYSKRDRYFVEQPRHQTYGFDQEIQYRFMSAHGLAMTFVYFYLFKTPGLRLAILPLLAADYYIWGPYYSSGALTGIAAGIIL
jgi:hypothetical protein